MIAAHYRLGPSAPCLAASLFGEEDSGQEGDTRRLQFCRVTFSAFLGLLSTISHRHLAPKTIRLTWLSRL